MINEEQYLLDKKNYEELKEQSENFIEEHFLPLFKSFNSNFSFNINIKDIKPTTKSGYVIFGNGEYLFVNFSIDKKNSLCLSYTEDSQQKSYNEMIKKAKLYNEVLELFKNFNVNAFNNLIEESLELSIKLSKSKRIFSSTEKEYLHILNKKYQNAILSIIDTYIDNEKANSILDEFVKTEVQEQLEYSENNRVSRRSKKIETFSFSFNLDKVIFKENKISISVDKKNQNKAVFYINSKKTSRKKCIESIQNQFLYKEKEVKNFNQFKTISEFQENLFERYSSWECFGQLNKIVKPFIANILAQNF